jgi:hypothetical protein
MNTRLVLFVFAVAACAPSVPEPAGPGPSDVERGGGAEGPVSNAAVSPVLEDARKDLAALEVRVAESEDVDARVALELDRIALASFVADLEACVGGDVECPPVLAEPTAPPTTTAWADAAAELARGACACRTHACAVMVLAELERWNAQLSAPDLDAAAEDETRARECASRRLGR